MSGAGHDHGGHDHHDHGAHSHVGHGHGAHDHAGHSHAGHSHAGRDTPTARLAWALGLTVTFMVVEAVAGFLSGSLALLSDAGHMLTDAGGLTLALVAQRIATRGPTRLHTFGFRRAEILAALVNGIVLGVSAALVLVEAARRLRAPPSLEGGAMLGVAIVGLVVNLVAAWILGAGGGGKTNANVRAAMLHVLSDAAGSVAAIVAGALIVTLGWRKADPIASILISLLILAGAYRLVRGSLGILMERVPEGLVLPDIEKAIAATPGVAAFHDLHVWTISEGFPVVTVHVVLDGRSHGVEVARAVGDRLREGFGLDHVTVQPEAPPPSGQVISVGRLRRRPP